MIIFLKNCYSQSNNYCRQKFKRQFYGFCVESFFIECSLIYYPFEVSCVKSHIEMQWSKYNVLKVTLNFFKFKTVFFCVFFKPIYIYSLCSFFHKIKLETNFCLLHIPALQTDPGAHCPTHTLPIPQKRQVVVFESIYMDGPKMPNGHLSAQKPTDSLINGSRNFTSKERKKETYNQRAKKKVL